MIYFRLLFLLFLFQDLTAQTFEEKNRIFVLTDISNEPDDEESLVRFLVYANEYDIEGIVATTSTWLRENPREDLIRRQLYAYGLAEENLNLHQPGFPSKENLLKITATGQPNYGMDGVGDGKSTAGSRLLEQAVDRQDTRPLWISVWGGANTLAQTLYDVRKERSPVEVASFVSKMKVYTISDQDDAGPWVRTEFPDLFYIVSPSTPDFKEYYRATWTGISGDRNYKNAPYYEFDLVDNPWLEENIISHGPLGNLYPKLEYIMEGDTPSFIGLIKNGLGWHHNPGYGGWAGRYSLFKVFGESRPIWTNTVDSRDCIEVDGWDHCTAQATIWRWRKHFQHDFAARMDWTVTADFSKANHNPNVVLNELAGTQVVHLPSHAGGSISLSARGTTDPDDDLLSYTWFIYEEAGTGSANATLENNNKQETVLNIAEESSEGTIHVILQVEDNGSPSLFSYRRAIITVEK